MDANQKAPDFTLPDENGKPIKLSSFKGKPVVLFFYPRANTPGCTVEACGFRDHYGKLIHAGLTVLGISPDTAQAQKKFQEKFSLPYPLLADAEKKVAILFDVLKEKNMYGKKVMGIERTTFLIAPDGTIAQVWRKVKPEGHAEQILAFVQNQNVKPQK
jgi:peroxiredoxin Q/BCP